MNKQKKVGFTLVELMVVAVIVAILAAVAIPLMSANKKRAMATEAEAGLGTIRTVLRAMYAQTGAYNVDLEGNAVANGSAPETLPGLSAGDLEGKYWGQTDYTLTTMGSSNYVITAAGAVGSDVEGVTLTLDQDGSFTRAGL